MLSAPHVIPAQTERGTLVSNSRARSILIRLDQCLDPRFAQSWLRGGALAARGVDELTGFKHIEQPKEWNLAAFFEAL